MWCRCAPGHNLRSRRLGRWAECGNRTRCRRDHPADSAKRRRVHAIHFKGSTWTRHVDWPCWASGNCPSWKQMQRRGCANTDSKRISGRRNLAAGMVALTSSQRLLWFKVYTRRWALWETCWSAPSVPEKCQEPRRSAICPALANYQDRLGSGASARRFRAQSLPIDRPAFEYSGRYRADVPSVSDKKARTANLNARPRSLWENMAHCTVSISA